MLTALRRIRQRLLTERKVTNYLLYAVGEVILVVLGILIALQINNWNEEQGRRSAEVIFYENIKQEVTKDKQQLLGEIAFNNKYTRQFRYADKIIEDDNRFKKDTLGKIAINLLNYSDFDKQGNIYETMVNSGQMNLLRNHRIINGIRRLEEAYLYINRMENIHYDAIVELVIPETSKAVKLHTGEIVRPEVLYSYDFQNIIVILLRIMEEKDEIYHNAINEIDGLLLSIGNEIYPEKP